MKIRCQSATHLFSELNNLVLSDNNLEKSNHDWIFRGQANPSWGLIPSVWRKGNLTRFEKWKKGFTPETIEEIKSHYIRKENLKELTEDEKSHITKWCLYLKFECALLSQFYTKANNAGLPLPDDAINPADAINNDFSFESTQPHPYPPMQGCYFSGDEYSSYVSFYCLNKRKSTDSDALAPPAIKTPYIYTESPIQWNVALPQHHGIPTRLLDWTTDPYKAIFFAIDQWQRLKRKTKKLVVWALQIKDNSSTCTNILLKLHQNHNRYQNKFLHAQDGVFTEILGDFYHYFEKGEWPFINKISGNWQIKKIIFPSECIEEIQNKLQQHGITLSRMMPSYYHAAIETLQSFPTKTCSSIPDIIA